MTEPTHGILAGDLLLRVRPDTSGLAADLSSKLTAAERVAETSGTRIAASSEKVRIAQLRSTAATEAYNRALQTEGATVEVLARRQATALAAQERVNTLQAEAARGPGLGFGSVVGLIGATVAAEKLFGAVEHGVRASANLEAVQRQTSVTLADTGDAAGVTAQQVDALAQAEAQESGVSRTRVIAAENLLATYTQINNEQIFNRAAKASVDLATAYARAHGTEVDVTAQARALGIALQDPLHGLDRLRRTGVAFTEQQREQVKALAASGHTLEAQTLILDLVNQKVGGSAEAFGQTAAGSAARAREAYEEFSISLAKNVLPVATRVLNTLTDTFDFFEQHKGIRDATLAVTGFATALYAVHKVEQAISVLRKSETIGIAARLLGYRSLTRAETQLAAAEDRHAESAATVALAERSQTTAMVGSTVAAETETVAQTGLLGRLRGRLGAATTGTAGVGLLGRLGTGLGIGLGGQLVGGLVRQQVGGAAGREAGADISDAAAGAGIGTAILPGVGTAVGAGAGLAFAERHRILSFFTGLGPHDRPDPAIPTYIDLLNTRYDTLSRRLNEDLTVSQQLRLSQQLLVVQHEKLADAAAHSANAVAVQAEKNKAAADKNVATAGEFLHKLTSGDSAAMQQVEQLTGSLPSIFDALTAQPSNANAATAAGRAAIHASDAVDRVRLAEVRLAEVRDRKGGPSAAALLSAEDAVKHAREASALAADDTARAEDKASAARTTTALSIQQVMTRAEQQVQFAQSQARAAQTLVRDGISAPVLAGLEQLDRTAPGTLQRIARNMTHAGAAELNKDQSLQQAAQRKLDAMWGGANLADAKKLAALAGKQMVIAMNNAVIAEMSDPALLRALRDSPLGQLIGAGLQGVPGFGVQPRTTRTGAAASPYAILVNGPVTLTTAAKPRTSVSSPRSLSTPIFR